MNSFLLYLLFVKIGALTFGGGYAMIPLFQDELVIRNHLISDEEFANMVALAQMTPGPVGLNAATYIGYQQNGVPGALAGTFGVMTPSLILVSLVAYFLVAFRDSPAVKSILTGIRPATVGLIAAAVIFFADVSLFRAPLNSLWTGHAAEFGIDWRGCVIFLLVLIAMARWKLNMIWTLILAAGLSWLLFLI